MTFSTSKFIRTLGLTLMIGLVAAALLRLFGAFGEKPANPGDPAELIRTATENLEAVRRRKASDRRPASYDSILAPLDKLLLKAREMLESEKYDPVNDYAKVRALTIPVIDIATKADTQARNETGMLTKEYRFNSQKAEACQYLASALWDRINRTLPEQSGFFNEGTPYPAGDMQELRRILDMGVQADPENGELYYARGILNRAEGLFGPAARDLEQAASTRNSFPGAWNTLGLVRINLKEFDKAEAAFERARAMALEEANNLKQEPGAEYVAIVYNLAMFHENLASHYARENRISATVENQRLLAKHTTEARRYLQEFLQREPSNSPDAKAAMAKLQALGR